MKTKTYEVETVKTFPACTADGRVEVPQLATLTHYVKGRQFRFVVLDVNGEISLTHRDSGKRVVLLTGGPYTGDRVRASHQALRKLVKALGEDRVYEVLMGAEAGTDGTPESAS